MSLSFGMLRTASECLTLLVISETWTSFQVFKRNVVSRSDTQGPALSLQGSAHRSPPPSPCSPWRSAVPPTCHGCSRARSWCRRGFAGAPTLTRTEKALPHSVFSPFFSVSSSFHEDEDCWVRKILSGLRKHDLNLEVSLEPS